MSGIRVTPGLITAQVTRDLRASLEAMARQQRMISTGRRVNEPADDPGAAAQALTVRSRQSANAQFQRNVDTARRTLGAADAALRSLGDTLQQAKDLTVQGGNDSNDAAARQAIGTQVDQILEAVVAFANGRAADGTMLFGGQEITVAPYAVTRDANGRITAVTPSARGVDGARPVEVSEGLTVAQGVGGTSVFGAAADATNAFSTLIRVRDALTINDGAAVRAELDNLTAVQDRAMAASLVTGTRLGWLDELESRLADESVTLSASLGTLEDADLAQAITVLNELQLYHEAGLASGARLLQQSLLDFLR